MLVPVLVLVQVLILYYLLVGLETEAQSVTAHPSLCYLLPYQAACLPLAGLGCRTLLRGGRTQYTIGVLSLHLLKREGSGWLL